MDPVRQRRSRRGNDGGDDRVLVSKGSSQESRRREQQLQVDVRAEWEKRRLTPGARREELRVPAHTASALIGRGGDNIKQLMRDSGGAWMRVCMPKYSVR